MTTPRPSSHPSAREVTQVGWRATTPSAASPRSFQNRTIPSSPPETTTLRSPSRPTATASTAPSWARTGSLKDLPSSSQNRTVPSSPPEMIKSWPPSRPKAKARKLAHDPQAETVQPGERGHVGVSESRVGHVEVFRMGSVRTSILGGPRPLSGQRRARTSYTLNCEEPCHTGRSMSRKLPPVIRMMAAAHPRTSAVAAQPAAAPGPSPLTPPARLPLTRACTSVIQNVTPEELHPKPCVSSFTGSGPC